MEEKLMDFMVEQREEMKGVLEWLENRPSLDTVSIKMDQMNETTKILMAEQERIKGQVNLQEIKPRKMEEERNFVDGCGEIIY